MKINNNIETVYTEDSTIIHAKNWAIYRISDRGSKCKLKIFTQKPIYELFLINKLLCTGPAELTALVNKLGYEFNDIGPLIEEDILAYKIRFDGIRMLIIETLKEYEKDMVYLIVTLKVIRNMTKMDINEFKKEYIKRIRKHLIENLDNFKDKEVIKIIKISTFMELYARLNNNSAKELI